MPNPKPNQMGWYPVDSRYSLTNHHHSDTNNHSQFSSLKETLINT